MKSDSIRNQLVFISRTTLAIAALAFPLLSAASPPWTVSLRSVGPVEIGSSISDFRRAMGRELGQAQIDSDCGVSWSEDREVYFYTRRGKVALATIYGGTQVRTRSGIGIGSTESQLYRTYPGRLVDGGDVLDGGGQYVVYVPMDSQDQTHRIVFHVDSGQVLSFSVGTLPDILELGESSRCFAEQF